MGVPAAAEETERIALDALQEEIAKIAFELDQSGRLALAGGGAMLAHGLVSRPTQDIDLFTTNKADLDLLVTGLVDRLEGVGYVVAVDRRSPTFLRLDVMTSGEHSIAVDLAVDARIRETVEMSFGQVLHPDELAADKMLALFGRAAPRDLVDVDALAKHYSRERLLQLAAEKDLGFDPRVFGEAIGAAMSASPAAYAELGLSSGDLAALRDRSDTWRQELTDRPTPSDPPPD